MKRVYIDIIKFNVQNQVQFSVMISRRVNANAYLTGLNLCINGAYGPIDSELWLHRARTQASDISHLEKLHNLTLWLDEPSNIWNKKRRDVFHRMFCSQFVPTSTACVTGKHCHRRKKELIRNSAPCKRQSLSFCPPTMNTQYQFKTEDYQRHSSQMTTS